jgi:hypothetical protein
MVLLYHGSVQRVMDQMLTVELREKILTVLPKNPGMVLHVYRESTVCVAQQTEDSTDRRRIDMGHIHSVHMEVLLIRAFRT